MAPDQAVTPAPSWLGQVSLSFEKQIDGWCLYPDRPTERAIVDLLVDGVARRAVTAAQPRPDLRALGMGDGYCGFLLPLPEGAWQEGGQTVVEVRERRFERLIGRVVIGTDKAGPQQRRMAGIERALRTMTGQAEALAQKSDRGLAEQMGHLGRDLLYLSSRPQSRADWHRYPGLTGGHDRVAAIPRSDLGWCAAPQVSVVVPSSHNIVRTATLLREAAWALRPISAEFILLDDGAQPLNALLPTRVRHLRLVRADEGADQSSSLDLAALSARGIWLAIAKPEQLSVAGLSEACASARHQTTYIDIGTDMGTLRRNTDGALSACEDQLPHGGLRCLIARDAFLAMGGFGRATTEDAMWVEFVDRARAVGHQVVGWQAPRRFRPLRHASGAME